MNINYVNINQTYDLLGIGTNEGFIIKNLKNKILIKRDIGLVNIIELYNKTNIIFLVGINNNILNIYDDNTKKYISSIKVDNKIELLKIEYDTILIVTKNMIYLYNLNTLDIKKQILINNLIIDIKYNYLVYLKNNKTIELYNLKINTFSVKENTMNNIQMIKISSKLNYLAMVSENGCTIKIFDINTNKLIREYYRGFRESKIKYISFNNDDTILFVYSDRNTLHIYKIHEQNEYFLSYIYSKYRINLKFNNIICIMNNNNILYVINKDNGIVSKYEYIKLD